MTAPKYLLWFEHSGTDSQYTIAHAVFDTRDLAMAWAPEFSWSVIGEDLWSASLGQDDDLYVALLPHNPDPIPMTLRDWKFGGPQ